MLTATVGRLDYSGLYGYCGPCWISWRIVSIGYSGPYDNSGPHWWLQCTISAIAGHLWLQWAICDYSGPSVAIISYVGFFRGRASMSQEAFGSLSLSLGCRVTFCPQALGGSRLHPYMGSSKRLDLLDWIIVSFMSFLWLPKGAIMGASLIWLHFRSISASFGSAGNFTLQIVWRNKISIKFSL